MRFLFLVASKASINAFRRMTATVLKLF